MTAEMVRLTTENDFLRQEKEKLDDSNSKMAQKAASLVRTTLYMYMYNVHHVRGLVHDSS